MTTEIRSALADFLEADEQLMKLAKGGIWYEVAGEKDNEVDPPYVIIGKPSGVPQFAFQGDSLDWDVWMIKGVGKVKIAEAIDKRIRELLTDAELEIVGRDLKYLRPQSDINYPEVMDGERYQHVGANYRLTSERSE